MVRHFHDSGLNLEARHARMIRTFRRTAYNRLSLSEAQRIVQHYWPGDGKTAEETVRELTQHGYLREMRCEDGTPRFWLSQMGKECYLPATPAGDAEQK
jgi:hypothetical protein